MRQQAKPVFIPGGDDPESVLQEYDFRDNTYYDEDWLQRLIHERPKVLPLLKIEPALRDAIPVCRELPLRDGSLDNLLVTPDGDLVLVECKLWRNPQARREVVAQIIDYAKELKRLDYASFEVAIATARGAEDFVLYDHVESELEEAAFVDAVSRNLRRGRAFLIVAGDGITESVEAISDYLQQHAGLHFTLALIQLSVYAAPGGGMLVVPSVPLRTSNIVRGIVTIEDGRAEISAPPATVRSRRPTTLTEDEFFAKLDELMPGTSERLLSLVEQGAEFGLGIDVRRSLMLRLPIGDENAKVMIILTNGDADTTYIWDLRDRIPEAMLREYLEDVARAIPGTKVQATPRKPYIKYEDRYLTIWDVLDHSDKWLEAVKRFRNAALSGLEEEP